MKTVFLILLIFTSFTLLAQRTENDEICYSFLEGSPESWKTDSLGQNGFRCLFYFYCLCRCPNFNYNGYEWNEVSRILGNPNDSGSTWKSYWLQADELGHVKALTFIVDTITGKVTKTVFEIE